MQSGRFDGSAHRHGERALLAEVEMAGQYGTTESNGSLGR